MRMINTYPGFKDALVPSSGSSRLVSNSIRAAATSLQLNDELMHDEISQGEPYRVDSNTSQTLLALTLTRTLVTDVDDATLLKALLSSYGREATVKALKTKALFESLLQLNASSIDDGDAAAFVFPSSKLPALASLPSLQHLMQGKNEDTQPPAAPTELPPSSPPKQTAPTTSLTPPRSFGKPGGSFAGRKPPRPVSASPQISTGAGLSQQLSQQDGTKSCGNCGTTHTSLWRKVNEMIMCNACGIYYKNHGYHRPMDLAAKSTLSQTSGAFESQGAPGGKKRRLPPPVAAPQSELAPLMIKPGMGGLGEDTATSPLARGSKAKGRKASFSVLPSKACPPSTDPIDGASGEMEEDQAKIDLALSEEEEGMQLGFPATLVAGGGARKSGRARMAKKDFGEEWVEPGDLVLRREGGPMIKRPRPQSSGGYGSEGYLSDYLDSQGPGTGSRGGGRPRHQPSNGGLAPPSPLRAVSAVQGGRGGGAGVEDGASPTSVEDLRAPLVGEGGDLEAFEVNNQSPLPSGLDGDGDEDGEGEASDSSDVTDLRVDADTSLVALALMQLKEAKGRWGLLPKVLQAGAGGGQSAGGRRSGNNTPAASFNPSTQREPSPSPLRPSPQPPPVSYAAKRTSSAGGAGRGRSKSPYSTSQRRASPEVTRSGGGAVGAVQCCSNCGTTKTPMWRKDKVTGAINCNACGIYRQTHGFDRPMGGSARNSADGSRGGVRGLTPPSSPLLTHSGTQGLPRPNLLPNQAPHTAPSFIGGLVRPLGLGAPVTSLGRPPLPPSVLSRETFPHTSGSTPPSLGPTVTTSTTQAPAANETMRAFEQLLSSMPGFPPHLSTIQTPTSTQPQSYNPTSAPFQFSLGFGMDLNALNRQIEAQHARQLQELQMHQQQLAMLQQLKQQAAAIQLSQEKEKAVNEGKSSVHAQGLEGSLDVAGGALENVKLKIEVPPSVSSMGLELRSSKGGFASPIPLSSPVAGFLAAVTKRPPSPSLQPKVPQEAADAGQVVDMLLQQALQQHQAQPEHSTAPPP